MKKIDKTRADEVLMALHPRYRLFEKVWHTYVRRRTPWTAVKALSRKLLRQKLVMDDPKYWEALEGDSRMYTPPYPADHVQVVMEEVDRVTAKNAQASILDLGCNAGRLLQAFYERGYVNLHGMDAQGAALKHMRSLFPDMSAQARIQRASFQEFFLAVPDRAFDIVCTWGATIELVPPSFPICQEMARAADRAVIMIVNENGHAYPRLWETEFLRVGFLLTRIKRPYLQGMDSSLLVFERMIGVS